MNNNDYFDAISQTDQYRDYISEQSDIARDLFGAYETGYRFGKEAGEAYKAKHGHNYQHSGDPSEEDLEAMARDVGYVEGPWIEDLQEHYGNQIVNLFKGFMEGATGKSKSYDVVQF